MIERAENNNPLSLRKGDWVSWSSSQGITIGEVMYITREPGGFYVASTTGGVVSLKTILEVRRYD